MHFCKRSKNQSFNRKPIPRASLVCSFDVQLRLISQTMKEENDFIYCSVEVEDDVKKEPKRDEIKVSTLEGEITTSTRKSLKVIVDMNA